MQNFADIDLNSIDDLYLPAFREMKINFANAIDFRKAQLIIGAEDKPADKEMLQELQNLPQYEFKCLNNYLFCKQYEAILPTATLKNSSVTPNLAELMTLALQHAPEDWRAVAYLRDDCAMINNYLRLSPTDAAKAGDSFEELATQEQNNKELLHKWQESLRSHYLAAMRRNMQEAQHALEKILQHHLRVKHVSNKPYAMAAIIIQLLILFEFLINNMHNNRSLNIFCRDVINALDQEIIALKDFTPNTVEKIPKTFGCTAWFMRCRKAANNTSYDAGRSVFIRYRTLVTNNHLI